MKRIRVHIEGVEKDDILLIDDRTVNVEDFLTKIRACFTHPKDSADIIEEPPAAA